MVGSVVNKNGDLATPLQYVQTVKRLSAKQIAFCGVLQWHISCQPSQKPMATY